MLSPVVIFVFRFKAIRHFYNEFLEYRLSRSYSEKISDVKNSLYLGLTKSSCTAIGSFLDQLTLDLFFS